MVLRAAVSFVLAADVVAVSVALADMGNVALAPFILLVMVVVSTCLAMPAYSVLRLRWRETWRSCVVAGFLVGATVAALVLLSVSDSMQVGREMTVIDGVRTAAGWRTYAGAVGTAGGIGAGAGGVFWAALRLLERAGRWPRLGRLSLTAGISLAIAASWTIFALPNLTADRSCHNVFRDGRESIGPVLFFTVELSGSEWSRFQDTAEHFAFAEEWLVDESNDKDKSSSASRFVSVCVEPGTEIMFSGADVPNPTRAEVSVFQPQGGNSWQGPVGRLLASIGAAFPGQLRRDWTSTEMQTPSALLPQQ